MDYEYGSFGPVSIEMETVSKPPVPAENKSKENIASWRKRIITTPPFQPTELQGRLNDVYLQQTMKDEEELKADIAKMEMRSSAMQNTNSAQRKNPKNVRNTIALFENMTKSPPASASQTAGEEISKRNSAGVIGVMGDRAPVMGNVHEQPSNKPLSETVGNAGIGRSGNSGIGATGNSGIGTTGHSGIGATGNAGIGATGNSGIVNKHLVKAGLSSKSVEQTSGSVEANLYPNVRRLEGESGDRGDCEVGESITEVLTDEEGGVHIVEIARL